MRPLRVTQSRAPGGLGAERLTCTSVANAISSPWLCQRSRSGRISFKALDLHGWRYGMGTKWFRYVQGGWRGQCIGRLMAGQTSSTPWAFRPPVVLHPAVRPGRIVSSVATCRPFALVLLFVTCSAVNSIGTCSNLQDACPASTHSRDARRVHRLSTCRIAP